MTLRELQREPLPTMPAPGARPTLDFDTTRIAIAPNEIEFDPHNAHKHTPEGDRILADSITKVGMMNDPLVYLGPDGRYRLIAGEGRIRAVLLLGYEKVHVRCLASPPSEQQRRDLALIDNLLKDDLDPLSFGLYCLDEMTRTGRSAKQLAQVLSNKKDASTITRAVARVNKLPEDLHHLIRSGELPPAVADVICGLHPDAEQQRRFARLYTSGQVTTGQALASAIRAAKNGAHGDTAGVAGFSCLENGCKISVTLPGDDLAAAEIALRTVLREVHDHKARGLESYKDFLQKKSLATKKASEFQQAQDALKKACPAKKATKSPQAKEALDVNAS